MFNTKPIYSFVCAILLSLLAIPGLVLAAQGATDLLVDSVGTQWSSGYIHVYPESGHSMLNPGSCSVTVAYAMDPDDPGHKERVAMIMTAVSNSNEVDIVVEGCIDSRPRIISVTLHRNV